MNRQQRRALRHYEKQAIPQAAPLTLAPVQQITPDMTQVVVEKDSQTYADPCESLRELVEIFAGEGRTRRELGEIIGCSDSAISGWLAKGTCPRAIERSCQLYLREMEIKEVRVYSVITVGLAEGEKMDALMKLSGLLASVNKAALR